MAINNAGKSAKLARWVLRLQDFTSDSLHRPGGANRVADALSRNPLPLQGPTDEEFVSPFLVTSRQAVSPPPVAFIRESERCQSCSVQARGF